MCGGGPGLAFTCDSLGLQAPGSMMLRFNSWELRANEDTRGSQKPIHVRELLIWLSAPPSHTGAAVRLSEPSLFLVVHKSIRIYAYPVYFKLHRNCGRFDYLY